MYLRKARSAYRDHSLNRPEKKNAISRDLYWALDECWQKAKADDDVWCDHSDRNSADAFCVGGDLKENLAFAKGEMKGPRSGPAAIPTALAADAQTDHRRDQRLRRRRRFQPGAVVPHSLLRAGHRSSAAPKCAGRTWPHGRAMSANCRPAGRYWFALTGQMIDADTAFRLGLVQKICEPDKLIDECVELATTINRNGRLIAAHTVEFIEDKLLYEHPGMGKSLRSSQRILRPSAPEQRLRRRFSGVLRETQTGIFARVLRREDQAAGSAYSG